MARSCSTSTGAFAVCATPSCRRMPRIVSVTMAELRGEASPANLCACDTATRARPMVATQSLEAARNLTRIAAELDRIVSGSDVVK